MAKVQVLALNDDNHTKCYVTRDKCYYNCADFVKQCLLMPHDNEYEVREVYICYLEGDLNNLTDDECFAMFDLLGCNNPQLLSADDYQKRNEIFTLFWDNSSDWNYV